MAMHVMEFCGQLLAPTRMWFCKGAALLRCHCSDVSYILYWTVPFVVLIRHECRLVTCTHYSIYTCDINQMHTYGFTNAMTNIL